MLSDTLLVPHPLLSNIKSAKYLFEKKKKIRGLLILPFVVGQLFFPLLNERISALYHRQQ
jgi:hypothetical protein